MYQSGKTVRTQQLALKYLANQRRRHWRAAVVVAKKVHKSAVVRNRVRRRIYAIVNRQLPSNNPAYDLVFTVFHEDVAALPAEELNDIITQLLGQAGILPPKPQQPLRRGHDMIESKE